VGCAGFAVIVDGAAVSRPHPICAIRYGKGMSDRQAWLEILAAERRRWSSMCEGKLLSELNDVQSYEVEWDSKKYQVEVELLEDTDTYMHVVAVDDGLLPASIAPVTDSFICTKPHAVR
jgi:hypothetical protein